MDASAQRLPCDGCGLPASPEHIAARIRRLELATRFRPLHIGILFVSPAPPLQPEDDFYAPAASREFSGPFLEVSKFRCRRIRRSRKSTPKTVISK
jgi:hypothetical protein